MCQNRHLAFIFVIAAISWVTPVTAQLVRPEPLQDRGMVRNRPLIPRAFRGHWGIGPEDCRRAPLGGSQVWITATSLDYGDMTAMVSRVAVEKFRSRAVVMLAADGDGMTFTTKKGLSLSPDRRNLTIRNQDDTGHLIYHRCSSRHGKNGSSR